MLGQHIRERLLQGNVRLMRFTPEVIMHMQRGPFVVVENAMPPTARFVDGWYDEGEGSYVAVVEDDSFDEVAEGEVPPLHPSPIVQVDDLLRTMGAIADRINDGLMTAAEARKLDGIDD